MKQVIFVLWVFLMVSISDAQVITTGNGTGAIPDNDPSGMIITFPVSGVTAPIESISLDMTINHTYNADLIVRLTAPNGIASIGIFGTTGVRRNIPGESSADLIGTYTFNDMASGDWWASSGGAIVPPGSYRSSTLSSFDLSQFNTPSDFGGCTTRMNGAFGGLNVNQSNGNWTLSIVDQFAGDDGTISAAVLTINEGGGDLIFADGFDNTSFASFTTLAASNVLGECKKTRFDFSGNGLADFAIAEDNGSAEIVWSIQNNDSTTVGATQAFIHGNPSTDFIMDGDIDGDGIKDPIVWRSAPAGQAAYYVRRSSRPNDDVLKFIMGQTGDVPGQIGDYDGDGIEDFALFRVPSTTGPSALIIHESSTGNIRIIDMISGTLNTLFSVSGYDYTGDGIADAAVQRTSEINPGVGEHLIYDGSTGNLFNFYDFGLNTDLLIPGNYLGDGRADTNLGRAASGNIDWYTRETGPGTEVGPTTHGLSAVFPLSGDYDGDGFDDYAVYDNSPGEFKFIIIPSSNTGTTIEVNLGSSGIYPVNNSRVQ